MSDLIFPSSPVVGQTYMAPGGKVWRYGGKGWICLVDSGSQIYYNPTPPDDVAKYPLWVNTDTGDLMVFYQDVDSDQWIKIGTTGGGSSAGGNGGATYINDLNDVDTSGISLNDVLEWDGTNWVPVAPSGAGSIDGLSDVDTTTSAPSLNNVLAWDNTNWIPYSLNVTNWDVAYTHSQATHAPTNADNTASNETDHSDVVIDGDFASNGIMLRTALGAYSITANNSTNWDTAYTHSQVSHAPTNADNTAANETSHSDVVQDGDFSTNGSMERTSLGTYITILHKKDATTAPLTTDDSGDGYSIGSRWIDVTNDKEYVAVDVTVSAAVWKETTGSGGGSSITVEDEGTPLTTAVTKFNFVGTGVTVTEPTTDEMLVTIETGIEYDNYTIGFTAYDSTGFSVPNATTTKVEFDTVSYDRGNNYSTSTYQFTAPVAGIYNVGGGTQISNLADGEYVQVHLYKNATTVFGSGSRSPVATATTAQARSVAGADIWLDEEDTVELRCFHNQGSAQTASTGLNNTYFYTHLIHATTKAECSFSANLDGTDDTTSITATVATKIPLSNTDFNYGNGFDATTNNRFDVTEDGRYFFSFSAGISTLTNTTTDFVALLYKNGSLIKSGNRNAVRASGNHISSGSDILNLLKDDYIELWVYQNESTSETIKGSIDQTWLTGYRLVTTPTETYNPIVYETEIITATDTIDVPTGNLGNEEYRFKLSVTNDNASTAVTSLYVNNDTTATNYNTQTMSGENTATAAAEWNASYISSLETTNQSLCTGTISVFDNIMLITVNETRITSGGPVKINTWGISNVATTFSSITDIQFKSDQTTGFGIGTKLTIYKD